MYKYRIYFQIYKFKIYKYEILFNDKYITSEKNIPELSSPTTNTFASFFLKPSAETNLSRNPMRRTKMSKQFSFNFLGCFSREGGLLMFFSLCSSATPRDDDDYCCGELL